MRIDPKLRSSATARNRDPILAVFRRVLPARGTVLEIASGAGEHAVYFASHLPDLVWQPSDPSAEARASIDAWREAARAPNVRPALALDVHEDAWPLDAADAVVCINMIHIAPWSASEALMRGAARVLVPSGAEGDRVLDRRGILFTYGPYKREGAHTAPSNAAFDADLRARNPSWGVRDLEAVTAEAARRGLERIDVVPMPANNLSLVFRRDGSPNKR
jgi:SAM-dependent methyltransferase